MIRLLIVFAFALFANSVGAKADFAAIKKNHSCLDQPAIGVGSNLIADDQGDDDFDVLKKRTATELPAFASIVLYQQNSVHGFTPKRVNHSRSLLARICVLRL